MHVYAGIKQITKKYISVGPFLEFLKKQNLKANHFYKKYN